MQKTQMKKRTLSVAVLLYVAAGIAQASSHREAPMITEMPALDGTDLYLFRSYEAGREGYVTAIANYYPLQEPAGGPNFFNLDPDAVYEIHFDRNGDSVEDYTLSFKFTTIANNITVPVGGMNVPVPVINVGPFGPGVADVSTVNVRQTYTVDLIVGNRRTGTRYSLTNVDSGSAEFRRPLDNVGAKSIADYAAYANTHIYPLDLPGTCANGRVFVGQRQEGFAVNVGPIFDLVNLNPLGARNAVPNPLSSFNITSLAVELPIACLAGADGIVGAWTTSSMRTGTNQYQQVSRLGMPLVNEAVIGLPDKDKFNASEPVNDQQVAKYVTNPTLPYILELLFSSAGAVAPKNFPRTDLIAAFTGVAGVNKPNPNSRLSEMLRLNTSIAPVAASAQNNLGVLGGDNAGFPNGRRPGDDVVDIELRVLMGALNTDATQAPNRTTPFTDQVMLQAVDYQQTFPYLNKPLPGAGSN